MSTRSYIVIERKKEDGTKWYEGIYCHHDGYPSGNGRILQENYQDRELVEKLISLGDMSSLYEHLCPTVGKESEHSFAHPEKGVCVFYGRDRGEEGVEPKEVDLNKLASDYWIEFVYIYTLDGKWMCSANNPSKVCDLDAVLKDESILY